MERTIDFSDRDLSILTNMFLFQTSSFFQMNEYQLYVCVGMYHLGILCLWNSEV